MDNSLILSIRVVGDVDVHVGVGEVEAVLREFGIETEIEVIENAPIVLFAHPGTDGKRDVVFIERRECHKRIGNRQSLGVHRRARIHLRTLVGGGEDTGIGMHNGLNEFHTFFGIGTILHADRPVHTAQRLGGHVLDIAAEECAVRQDDDAVVGGKNLGRDDRYLHHGTRNARGGNEIARLEGTENKKHNAAGKVLHRTRQRHTDSHTAGSEQGGKRGGIDTEGTDGGKNQHHRERDADEGGYEGSQCALCVATLKDLDQEPFHPLDKPCTNQVDDKSHQYFESETNGTIHHAVPK